MSKNFCFAGKSIPQLPPDTVYHTKVLFANDTFPMKQNLGIGAYRTEEGKPYVFDCVRKAADRYLNDPNLHFEYPDIIGNHDFVAEARKLLFGNNQNVLERIASCQTISGTGATRIGADFLSKFHHSSDVYISDPTWVLHGPIFRFVGMNTKPLPYYDQKKLGLNLSGILDTINNSKERSIFIIQGCAQNPTGVDPTIEEWKQITEALKSRKGIVFLDIAYQGFATGDFNDDAFSARYLAEQPGLDLIITQSFSKNLGLYGQRTGCLHILCDSSKDVPAIESQFEEDIRAAYTCPPQFGACVANIVMKEKNLFKLWQSEIKELTNSLKRRRKILRDELEKLQVPSPNLSGDWSHITSQIGMFSYTGLSPKQCQTLVSDYHIYILSTGRIAVPGVLPKNISYVGRAIQDVVKRFPK